MTTTTTTPSPSRRRPSHFKSACLLALVWGVGLAHAHAAAAGVAAGEPGWKRGLGAFEAGVGRVGVAAMPAPVHRRRSASGSGAESSGESTTPNRVALRASSYASGRKARKAQGGAGAGVGVERAEVNVFALAAAVATDDAATTTTKATKSKSKAKATSSIAAALAVDKTVTVTTLSGTTAAASTVTATATATATVSGSATSALVSTSTAVPSGYALPRAFDSTLGTNFTSTACPSFFATFLADPDFIACTPFSLLLATSSAFFTAQQSPYSLLPYVMDASCEKANKTQCDGVMASYAQQIKASSTCGPDLSRRNPLVVQALAGFQNYDMLYKAGCLRNNVTDQYCFAEAAAQSTASELYFWYLPEGTGLPSGTVTSCESCTQDLMDIYADYATNSTLLISQTYASARTLAVGDCGPTFANYVAPVSAASSSRGASTVAWAMALGLVGWWTLA